MKLTKSLANHRSIYIYILVLGLVAVLPLLINYRFVKDDTNNVFVFYEFLNRLSLFEIFTHIASNEWVGYQPRSFFLTWWIQVLLIKFFGMSDMFNSARLPFAVTAAIVHIVNALLIFKISKKYLNINSAKFVSLGYLVLPCATVDYLISNNWFFLFPLFFYLLFLSFWIEVAPMKIGGVLGLILLLSCVMFSGEQLIALPYAIGIAISLYLYFSVPRVEDYRKIQLQSLIVYGAGIIIFVAYSKATTNHLVAAGEAEAWRKNVFDLFEVLNSNTLIILLNYCFATLGYIWNFLNLKSHLFGQIEFSTVSILLSIIFTLGAFVLFFRKKHAQSTWLASDNTLIKFFILWFGLLGCMLPMFFAALTGIRPGPDDRYLMVPAFMLFLLFVVIFERSTLGGAFKRFIACVILGYFSFVTFHISWDVWRAQAFIDGQLWKAVFQVVDKNAKYILTINDDPYEGHRGLQRPYQSIAWTDFQADWGVRSRLKYSYDYNVILVQNLIPQDNGQIEVVDYWGKKFRTSKDEIGVIYFKDSPILRESLSREIIVMNYIQYLDNVLNNGAPNRIISNKSIK